MKILCFNCKKYIEGNVFHTNFGDLCEECHKHFPLSSEKKDKKIKVICKKCGKSERVFRKDIHGFSFDYICDACKAKESFICDWCNTKHQNHEKVTIKDIDNKTKNFCHFCATRHILSCKHCGEKYIDYDAFFVKSNNEERDVQYCKHCFEKDCFECEVCGIYHIKAEHEHSEEKLCTFCFNTKCVHEYMYKPSPVFFGEKEEENDFYIGVELELEGFNEDKLFSFVKEIDELKNFIYMKTDGSLNNFGVELVSHPANKRFHVTTDYWEKVFELILKYDMFEDENGGLHFHVDKKSLTKYNDKNIKALAALDYFVSNNEDLIKRIGGRGFCGYCEKREKNWGIPNRGFEHFQSINLCNKNTVEIRFCKNTSEYHEFIKRLVFIHDLVIFARNINFNDLMNSNDFGLNYFYNMFNQYK